MFQLLQPLWLIGISAVSIPVFIHLWNNRKGRTLEVGSILLIEQSVVQQSRSFRLTEILLLLLRCLLIIILSILLANPVWKKNLTATKEKGWLLIERESLQEAYNNSKPIIDSLLSAGYKFHYFNTGFAADNFEEALKARVDSNQPKYSYWSLLKQLNEIVPDDLPVSLFTNNDLNRVEGNRPVLSMNLKWETYNSNDTIAPALAKAYKTVSDSLRLVIANGSSNALQYAYENLSADAGGEYNLRSSENKIWVTANNSLKDSVELDTTSIRIEIFPGQYTADADYLKAALDAIRQYTEKRIFVSMVNDPSRLDPSVNWLFWLSDKPLPKQIPLNIFLYEKGKEQEINSWIRTADYPVNQEPISLFRRINNNSQDHESIWSDGYGNSLLGLEKNEKNTYHFYSRINPEWNDLPWSPQFVKMIFDILIRPDINQKKFDRRTIDKAQLLPANASEHKILDKEKFVETTELSKIFWFIAFIIFSIERFLSLATTKKQAGA